MPQGGEIFVVDETKERQEMPENGQDAAPVEETVPADDSLFLDLPDESEETGAGDETVAADAAVATTAPGEEAAEETSAVAVDAAEADAGEAAGEEIAAEGAAEDAPEDAGEDVGEAEQALTEEEVRQRERKAKMQWYVIHANTGHENKVKRNIEIAIKSNHMEEYFGEVLVATQEVTEMKNGKRTTVKRKFFPSYVLVEMQMTKQTQHFINNIPGVTRFVGGTPLKPQPITKEEVDRILGRISAPQEAKTMLEIPYEIGESVQVIDGPFTDWIGVINEINHDKGKLKVMISIFGSETPVELDFLQVKSI